MGIREHYELFQPQKSALVVLNTFPEYFKLEEMKLPEAARACEHEAIWLDEAIFRAGQKGVDDAVAKSKCIHSQQDAMGEYIFSYSLQAFVREDKFIYLSCAARPAARGAAASISAGAGAC